MDLAMLSRPRPDVKLLDVRSDVTNLTTYTFTSVNLGDLGGTMSTSGDAYSANPHVKAKSRKMVAVIVHGEDAATTFGVNSVTIGGVAGTENIDRGGATVLVNTAIYWWPTSALQGITSTDVVVTFSEAVTSCAIGVVLIDNIGLIIDLGPSTAQDAGTGTMQITITPALANSTSDAVILFGSTCATGTETVQFNSDNTGLATSIGCQGMPINTLYDSSNAEIAFAAGWTWIPAYPAGAFNSFTIVWSGTGACDAVASAFI